MTRHLPLPISPRVVEVIGHGGAGDFFPGNGRQSIAKALEIGVDRIECDVQLSADQDLVLVHDDQVETKHHGKRPIGQISTADLREALPGLLTFAELVALVDGEAPLLIDVKNAGYEPEIIAAINRHDLTCCVAASSTHTTTLRRLRSAFPEMRLGLSSGHMAIGARNHLGRFILTRSLRLATPYPLVAAAVACHATDVMIYHRVCTERLVNVHHERNLRVNVWTVDQPSAIRRAIALGVDGIISNRPDLVWEELAAAGLHAPRAR